MWKFQRPVCSLGLCSSPPLAFILFSLSTSLSRSRLGHLLSVNEIIMPTFAGTVAVHMTAHSHHQRIAPTHIYIYAHIYTYYIRPKGADSFPHSHFSFIVRLPKHNEVWAGEAQVGVSGSSSFVFFFNSINCPLKTLTPMRRATMELRPCAKTAPKRRQRFCARERPANV